MNFIDACALYRKSLWEKVGGYDEHMPSMAWEDWDFWLRVAAHGGAFFHLPKIGFDYRVRSDYKLLRETDEEVQQLRGGIRTIQNSPSYRLGRGLLAPARLLRKLWRGVY